MKSVGLSTTDPFFVSVVVPLYNGGPYIESALKSILAQSYDQFEIVVVDDGSSDDGSAKVTDLSERDPGRIRLIHHPDRGNHGIAASRNLGIRNARGGCVAFLDQDDLWLADKLEKQVEALRRHPDAAFVYSKSSFVDQEGLEFRVGGVIETHGKGRTGNPQNIFGRLIVENIVPSSAVLLRRSCLEEVGFFDEGPRHEYEDWILWSKCAYFHGVVFLPEILSKHRRHEGSYSRYRLESGLHHQAEEHYIISLFTYLLNCEGIDRRRVKKLLNRRLLLFFLRARSWGANRQALQGHALNLARAFPESQRAIRTAARFAVALPPRFASIARRLRRAAVGT